LWDTYLLELSQALLRIAAASRQCYGTAMKSRYIFILLGTLFLIFAVVEFVRTANYTAVVVNAITAVIFLFLGVMPAKRR
jgi:hypothetical protein